MKGSITLQSVEKMLSMGGSFEVYIAKAWQVADSNNKAKLEAAFYQLFARYQ